MKKTWFLDLVVKLSGVYKPLTISSFLSVVSLSVGVATLLVAMALVDSYEAAFEESIKSVFSDGVFYVDSHAGFSLSSLKSDIKSVYKNDFKISPSSKKEALLAHQGKVSGVILDGVDWATINDVVLLDKKVLKGSADLKHKEVGAKPQALLGKSLAEKFNLKVGDVFSVVVPQINVKGAGGFSRNIYTFRLGGILDFGSHHYNDRFILANNADVNKAAQRPLDFVTEIRLKLSDSKDVVDFKENFSQNFSQKYWFQSWLDKSGSLLDAIKYERIVIYLILLVLVVVAAFNVSTNLYLNLAKRLKDFSILQTIGMTRRGVFNLIVLNGFLLASIGVLFGGLISVAVVTVLNFVLQSGLFIPPDVYKLTTIHLSLSFSQFFTVALSAFVLCFLASLVPAVNVFKFSITKGLRYE